MSLLVSPRVRLRRAGPSDLSTGERSLIRVRGIYIGAASIMNIFLGLYLLHVGGVATVATYYSSYFACIALGFLLAAPLLRRSTTSAGMRWGAVSLCAVYLALILLGEGAVEHALLMGALAGVGSGLFWAGHNLTEYFVTDPHTRNLFLGRTEFVSQLAATVAPPVAGVVLFLGALSLPGETRYYVLFALLAAALLAVRAAAGRLPDVGGVTFTMAQLWCVPRGSAWSAVLTQNLLRGMWESAHGILTPILIFLVVRGELAVSLFAAGTTLLSGFAALLAGRVLHRRPGAYVIGIVSVPVGLLALALGHHWLALAAYVLLVPGGDHFARIGMARGAYAVMDSGGSGPAATYHLFVQREIALAIGRTLSFLLVLWLTTRLDQMQAVSYGLALVAVMPLGCGLLQRRMDRAVGGVAAVPVPVPRPAPDSPARDSAVEVLPAAA